MRRTILVSAASLLFVTLAPTTASAQAPPPIEDQQKLTFDGGVSFSVPSWKHSREDEAVAVLEQVPAPQGDEGFYLLALVAEQGPAKVATPDWQSVRDNMAAAAREAGTTVKLEDAGELEQAPAGFVARRMKGSLEVSGKTLHLEVVALLKAKLLVTVSVITAKEGKVAPLLVEAVARSTRAGP